jgi:DNA ligase (NAD+)
MGEKMAKKIIKGIEDSKNRPFERVIYALSIPNVGETTAKRLAQSVVSMERLKELTVEELTAIPDVGPIIARSIYDFLREPINVEIINTLTIAGLQMCLSEEKLQAKGTSLEGKSIVISGTFTQHSREEYKEIIEREGGKNVGSISQKTSFVLAGENMGPSKRAKCESLGIPMVSENEFLSMINK